MKRLGNVANVYVFTSLSNVIAEGGPPRMYLYHTKQNSEFYNESLWDPYSGSTAIATAYK